MCTRARMHASLRRGEEPTRDAMTGEIRVPLALYDLDEHRGDTELVLARGEAEALFDRLRDELVSPAQVRRPEPVR